MPISVMFGSDGKKFDYLTLPPDDQILYKQCFDRISQIITPFDLNEANKLIFINSLNIDFKSYGFEMKDVLQAPLVLNMPALINNHMMVFEITKRNGQRVTFPLFDLFFNMDYSYYLPWSVHNLFIYNLDISGAAFCTRNGNIIITGGDSHDTVINNSAWICYMILNAMKKINHPDCDNLYISKCHIKNRMSSCQTIDKKVDVFSFKDWLVSNNINARLNQTMKCSLIIKPFKFNQSITCTVNPTGGVVVIGTKKLIEAKCVYLFINYTIQPFLGDQKDPKELMLIPQLQKKQNNRMTKLYKWINAVIDGFRLNRYSEWQRKHLKRSRSQLEEEERETSQLSVPEEEEDHHHDEHFDELMEEELGDPHDPLSLNVDPLTPLSLPSSASLQDLDVFDL